MVLQKQDWTPLVCMYYTLYFLVFYISLNIFFMYLWEPPSMSSGLQKTCTVYTLSSPITQLGTWITTHKHKTTGHHSLLPSGIDSADSGCPGVFFTALCVNNRARVAIICSLLVCVTSIYSDFLLLTATATSFNT